MSSFLRRGFFAFCLLFVVSACGQSGDESKPTVTGTDTAETKADPPVTAASPDDEKSTEAADEPAVASDDDITTASAEDVDMSDDEAETADGEDADSLFVPPSPDRVDEKSSKVALEKRPELTGRWFAVMSNGGVDIYIWLLEVVETDDAEAPDGMKREWKVVTTLDEMKGHAPLAVRELTKDSTAFAFTFADEETELTLDFEGTLRDGIVFGNLMIPGGDIRSMRLLPTKENSLKGHDKPDETAPGRKVLTKVVESKDPVDAMRKFCQKYSDSPVSLEVYKQLIAGGKESGLEADVVKEIYNEFVETAKFWGSRMEYDARLDGAFLLAASRSMPEYAIELFDELEKSIPEGMEEVALKIESGRDLAHVEIALRELESDDADIQKAAYQRLQEFHEKNPFDPNLIHAMAQEMEKRENTDEAIALYAELASLPMLENFLPIDPSKNQPMPSETLEKLWQKKHGNTDELATYLDEVYKKRIHSFVKEPVEATAGGNHIQLVELFTGAMCPPCVAADIAAGGLEATFSPSDLIVIRYHQHNPGPDPMANEDSEARFGFYPIRGTPSVFIDGSQFEGVGGYLPQTIGAYNRMKKQVEEKLGHTSDVKIELQVSGTAPEHTLTAKVSGLPDDADDLRLRIVLAEKEVDFIADNGVRVHEMVVRAMLKGAEGIPVSPDQAEFQESVNIDEFKKRLGNYLRAFEEGQDVEFSDKPLELNRLQVVAFVQNDKTKEILQTASIPLTPENQAAVEDNTTTAIE